MPKLQKKHAQNEHGLRHVTPPGRSVFYDLGLDETEARALEMRAELMVALRKYIEKKAGRKARRNPLLNNTPRSL